MEIYEKLTREQLIIKQTEKAGYVDWGLGQTTGRMTKHLYRFGNKYELDRLLGGSDVLMKYVNDSEIIEGEEVVAPLIVKPLRNDKSKLHYKYLGNGVNFRGPAMVACWIAP